MNDDLGVKATVDYDEMCNGEKIGEVYYIRFGGKITFNINPDKLIESIKQSGRNN